MKHRFPIFLAASLLLASCGGGGGGGGEPSTPSVPSASISISVSSPQIYLGNDVTISWSTTNATSCEASGDWSGVKSLSGEEVITQNSSGQKSFTLTCQNSEGSSTSRTATTNVLENVNGIVVGLNYLNSAEVILDLNSNFVLDDGEPSFSSSDGNFELPDDSQDIISFGGADTSSGTDFINLTLSAKSYTSEINQKVVSPITSFDFENTSATSTNDLLNLDENINFLTENPVVVAFDDSENDSASDKYFEINSQLFVLTYSVQSYINQKYNNTLDSRLFYQILYQNISDRYENASSNGIDLSELIEKNIFISEYIVESFVAALGDSPETLEDESVESLVSMLSSLLPVISSRTNEVTTRAIINFASGAFMNDVQSLANNSLSPSTLNSYVSNINTLIASDQNIDEDTLIQTIVLADDFISLNEDESLDFSPLSNDTIDVGNDYYGLSISLSNPQHGSASINSSNVISYIPNENYFGEDTFNYSVNVDGTLATAKVDIEVVSVNDPPTFKDFVVTSSIDENTIVVLTVTVVDVEDDTIGFSLSGDDSGKLSISTSGEITFNSNPDFETPDDTNSDNQYDITVEASDGTDIVTADLSITILDVENEGNPIIEGLSSQSVNENENIALSFTVTDPQDDDISFSLSGIDSELFALSFDGLNASITADAKDYEIPEDSDSNNVYLLSVNFSDDLNTTTQEVEISVSNINDNDPVLTSPSSFDVPENQNTVGTLTATDADNDDLIFSISSGDSSLLNVTDDGVLTLKENANFELKNTYTFTGAVTDGVYSSSMQITVNISDVNEAPTFGSVNGEINIDENITSSFASISASDEDGDSLIYSLTGDDASLFTINSLANISFVSSPDFEDPSDANSDNIYSFAVIASDGSLSVTSPNILLTIINVNDNAPTFLNLNTSVEVTNGQSKVFDISYEDMDGDDVSLSKTGLDSSLFTVSDDSLSFVTAPDFSNPQDSDNDNVYKLSLVAEDGSFSTTSDEISITVLEVNDPPIISGLDSSYSHSENIEDIASFTVTDPENNTLTIGVSGDDATNFAIVDNTLKFINGANFESPTDQNGDNVYDVEVFADDGFNRTSVNVQITVTNVDEAPEFNITEEVSVQENIRSIALLEINDPEGDSFTWSLSGGDDSDIISLSGVTATSGTLRFNSALGMDYEDPQDADGDGVYLVQLTATEDKAGGLSTVLDVRITVTDIKDTWTIGGTLLSNPYTLIDGDVPDIVYYPPVPNNDIDSAQLVLNPTDVIGRVGDNVEEVIVLDDDGFCVEDPDNLGYCLTEEVSNVDPEDWYSFSGAPNLLLTLTVEGLIYEEDGSFYCCETDSMDIDLLIYNEDGTLADFTYTSTSSSTYQQVVIPSSGNYYAVVKSTIGTSKYVLTLGSNIFGVSSLRNPENQFAENRFISYIPFGKDFDTDSYIQPTFDSSLNDLNSKLDESKSFLPEGLRVINFDLNSEFEKIFGDNYMTDAGNLSQVKYLKHWKLLQHYKEQYPKLNLELDFKEQAHLTKDPAWPFQWGLAQIGLDSVLSTIGSDVKDVAVAVLDSGSPEVGSTAWNTSAFLTGGYDFVPFTNAGDGDGYDTDPTDSEAASDSHGTHVATTISALNDSANINGFGIWSVPMRVLGRDGTGFRSDIVQGLLYAAGLPNASNTVYTGGVPIKVINMSLGSTGGSCGTTYQNAINDVYDRGITVVSSSGNEAQEAPGFYGYPASCNNVISVGATDYLKNRAYYSTYNDQVDIAAPGGDLTADLSADGYADGILAFDTNEDLSFLQGTSMASPHAAGAIAVLYALVPTLQPFQIDGLLADGHLTDDVGAEGKDDEFGYGALNLQKAVNRIISDEGLDFTYATVDRSTFNMGVDVDNFDFNVSKVGDGELSIVSIESDISSAFNITSSNTDAEGFGEYTVSLDRSQVPDGLYQSTITVSFSNENSVVISISFQVGADRERISIPTVYLQLLDEFGESQIAGRLSMEDGGVGFYVDGIAPGNYYWRFSTIIDSFIMDPAEFFNYYPDLSDANEYFVLGENDIENAAVTLRVNKTTGGLSQNNKVPASKIRVKVEDFNKNLIKIN